MVIPAASRLKNVEWDSQTVLFCWASQGVWPPEADGTEVIQSQKLHGSVLRFFLLDISLYPSAAAVDTCMLVSIDKYLRFRTFLLMYTP